MREPRSAALRLLHGLVWTGSLLSVAGAVHAARNARMLRHLRPGSGATGERVSVLIPARDEARTIAACVTDVLSSTSVPDLQVLVLDDHSADDTSAVARQAAGGDPRCTVLRSDEEPPPGWLGKPNACRQLAAAADGTVLVFVDADVRLAPAAIAAAVTDLRASNCDLLSAWPQQVPATVLGRLVQPLQQWSWLTTLPLGAVRHSARPALSAANGQFLVVDTRAYAAAGGHAAVAAAVLDDVGLAHAFKRAGLVVDIVDASQVARCRMYDTGAALVDGYAKSLWSAFGGPGRGLLVAGALAGVWVGPAVAAVLARDRLTRLAGLSGYAAGVSARRTSAAVTGGTVWPDSLAHPGSIAAFAGLMVVSAWRHHRGGLAWRGRPVTTG